MTLNNIPRIAPTRSRTTDRQGTTGNQSASSAVNTSNGLDWWTESETKLFTQWASSFDNYNNSFNNPYFDYFFTGQDVQISIDGLDAQEDLLPIYSFAYNIQQQKQPLYGFWDYTYAAMLRGTRIVTGAFSIVSIAPHLLTSKIAKAAQIRSQTTAAQASANLYAIRGLDQDESSINAYWRRNYDYNLDPGQQHIFSVHPPFNLILTYGLQETSIVHENPSIRANELKTKYRSVDPMMSDYNERLVKNPVPDLNMQILLENVEIVSKQMEFDTDGNPLLETYTFMARDERMLKPISNVNMTPYVPNRIVAEPTTTTNSQSSQIGTAGGRLILRS